MSGDGISVDVIEVRAGEAFDLAWAKRAEQLQLEALPTVRGSAERWAAALTGLLGAVAIASVLGGPGKFDTISGSAQSLGKAALYLAAVLALLAVGFALRAAQVTSKRLLVPSAGSFREASEEAVASAVAGLTLSRWLAALAIVATLIAGGCLWWGEQEKPAPRQVEVRGCFTHGTQARQRRPPADSIVRCVDP